MPWLGCGEGVQPPSRNAFLRARWAAGSHWRVGWQCHRLPQRRWLPLPCANSSGREMGLLAWDRPRFSPHYESRFVCFHTDWRWWILCLQRTVHCRLQWRRGITELVLMGRAGTPGCMPWEELACRQLCAGTASQRLALALCSESSPLLTGLVPTPWCAWPL